MRLRLRSMRKRLLRRFLPLLPEFCSLLFLECWPTDDHTHPGISSYSVSSYLKVAWCLSYVATPPGVARTGFGCNKVRPITDTGLLAYASKLIRVDCVTHSFINLECLASAQFPGKVPRPLTARKYQSLPK